ncbi:MAG: DNA repair protein RadA [Bacteroidales bacterium]|nr:DNA repair protein RadA [Bacteroidales bacterium]
MAKNKTVYLCQNCGADFPKWMGKCPACGQWGTLHEEVIREAASAPAVKVSHADSRPQLLSQVDSSRQMRIATGCSELDRVLGGGIVPGSVTLLGGEPGVGKSTLVLQTILQMPDKKVLYVSGEESLQQIKLRADRIQGENPQAWFVSETLLEKILEHVDQVQPDLLVVDSIQTLYTETAESSPGSVTQVRECAATLLRVAKTRDLPVILIGHINKEGSIAGPKVLEHIVDTVLLFEGDSHYVYRILRSIKNRFGSIAEIGMYEMRREGLREVSNPSELLLSRQHLGLSGVSIAAAIEGIRPFMIETQALVSTAAYGVAQRSTTGFEIRRLNMLLAVLEKRAGFKIAQKDVFLNIAGGIKVSDPAIDLAVLTAILSSNLDIAVDKDTCLAGEVGLAGEIRPVSRIEQRIMEAQKLGFKRIVIPDFSGSGLDLKRFKIEVASVKKVEEAFRLLFG